MEADRTGRARKRNRLPGRRVHAHNTWTRMQRILAVKRAWQSKWITAPEARPEGARSPRNVVAECAIMADGVADIVTAGKVPDFDMEKFYADMAARDSDEKATALGTGFFLTWVLTYTDQNGEVLGRQRFRVLRFRPAR